MKKHAVLNLITAAANVVYIAYLVVIFAGTWSHGAAHDSQTWLIPGYSSIIRLYLYLWPMLIVDTAVLVKNFLRLTRREVCTKEAVGVILLALDQFFIFAMMDQCVHYSVILGQPVFGDSDAARAVFLIAVYIAPFIAINAAAIIISVALLAKKDEPSDLRESEPYGYPGEDVGHGHILGSIRKKAILNTALLSAGLLSALLMAVFFCITGYNYGNVRDSSLPYSSSAMEAGASYAILIGALQLIIFVVICAINRSGSGMPYNDKLSGLAGAGLFITNIALIFNAYGTGFSYMLSENAAVIVFAFTALSVVIDAAALFINVNILKNVRSMDVYDDTYAYGK